MSVSEMESLLMQQATHRLGVIQRLEARVAHLEKYAGHRWTCDTNRILTDDNDIILPNNLPCSCGFGSVSGENQK